MNRGTDAAAADDAGRRALVVVVGLIVMVSIVAAVVLALNGATAGVQTVGAIGSFALGALTGAGGRR